MFTGSWCKFLIFKLLVTAADLSLQCNHHSTMVIKASTNEPNVNGDSQTSVVITSTLPITKQHLLAWKKQLSPMTPLQWHSNSRSLYSTNRITYFRNDDISTIDFTGTRPSMQTVSDVRLERYFVGSILLHSACLRFLTITALYKCIFVNIRNTSVTSASSSSSSYSAGTVASIHYI